MEDKDLEALLRAAASGPEEKESRNESVPSSHSHAFAQSLNIRSGKMKISNLLLYQHYLDWCEKHKEKRLERRVFFRSFKKLGFKQGIKDGYRYYLLVGESFDLSQDYLDATRYNFEIEKKKGGGRVW